MSADPRVLWLEADTATLIRLRKDDGMSITQIAGVMDIAFERVEAKLSSLHRAGYFKERNAAAKHDLAEFRAKLPPLVDVGKTINEIAEILGVTRSKVESGLESTGLIGRVTKRLTRPKQLEPEPWERVGISRERYLAGNEPLPAFHPIAAAVLRGGAAV